MSNNLFQNLGLQGAGVGVAHFDSNGFLSSSLIVNADIDAAAAIANSKLAGAPASAATPSTIVLRDGSGNFSANVISAALTGNSSSSTYSSNATIADDASTNATMYPVWVTANTGNIPLKVSSTKFTANPSSGLFTAIQLSSSILLGSSNLLSIRAGGSIGGTLILQGGTSSSLGLNTVQVHTLASPGSLIVYGGLGANTLRGDVVLSSATITSYESSISALLMTKTASNVPCLTGAGGNLIAAAASWSSVNPLISLADSSTGAATTSSITLSSSSGNPRLLFGTSADYIEYNGGYTFTASLLPDSNAGANLGSTSFRWNQVFFSNIRLGTQTTLDTNMIVQGTNSVTQQAKMYGFVTYSDEKLKTEIIDVDPEDDLEVVLKTRTVRFMWDEGYGDNIEGQIPRYHSGYLAQDVAKYAPEFCGYDENGEATSIDMGKMSRLHGGAIKALYNRMQTLEKFLVM